MAAIDLIVLGILKKEPASAYEIQKLVEYRNISRWVKISTPSIYKKVLQLEEKGYISGSPVREGRMAEKAVYTLTEAGRDKFEALMLEIARGPVHLFLDLNAVIVNLDQLTPEKRALCLENIGRGVRTLREQVEENLDAKKDLPGIPGTGLAVLRQQLALAEAIETWLDGLDRPGGGLI